MLQAKLNVKKLDFLILKSEAMKLQYEILGNIHLNRCETIMHKTNKKVMTYKKKNI